MINERVEKRELVSNRWFNWARVIGLHGDTRNEIYKHAKIWNYTSNKIKFNVRISSSRV